MRILRGNDDHPAPCWNMKSARPQILLLEDSTQNSDGPTDDGKWKKIRYGAWLRWSISDGWIGRHGFSVLAAMVRSPLLPGVFCFFDLSRVSA